MGNNFVCVTIRGGIDGLLEMTERMIQVDNIFVFRLRKTQINFTVVRLTNIQHTTDHMKNMDFVGLIRQL